MADQSNNTPGQDSRRTFRDLVRVHKHHEDLSALQQELDREHPDSTIITGLVERLHLDPDLNAKIGLWWSAPQTQAFLAELNAMGL